jgi:N-acetyl-gamma-glutamyl-phosphate reductase
MVSYHRTMRIGVVGASGYAGGELLRYIAQHPHFTATVVTAHSNAGELITSVHPSLHSYSGLSFSAYDSSKLAECDLVFLALPHGESSKVIAQLNSGTKIVDLGADYRLADSQSWSKYYGGEHAGTWTYGAPELPGKRAQIVASTRVANPGCYATSIALGTAPSASFADLSDVVVVAASGTTGAGRTAKINLIASEVMGSLSSYKFGGTHQHTPEIEEALSSITGSKVGVLFTPILAPMPRGILATISVKLTRAMTTEAAHAHYLDTYKTEPFISVLPLGEMPKTSSVTGTNFVTMQVAVDAHTNRLVISVAIDNLGKGAAGQAIQNANLICGFPETAGLAGDGVSA